MVSELKPMDVEVAVLRDSNSYREAKLRPPPKLRVG